MVDRYMDGYGSDDMSTPEIKLIQSVGGQIAKDQGATPGDFYLPLTDEVIKKGDGLDIVIADIIKTRTYWGRSEMDAEPPECASTDARSMRSIFGNDCAICDKRVEMPGLIENKDERRKKCSPGFTILAIRADESRMPVLIRAHGINATPTRELITLLKINRQVKGAYEKVLIHLSSNAIKTPSGEAFVMAFKPKAIITDDKASEFLLQTKQLLGSGALTEPTSEELPRAEVAKQIVASEEPATVSKSKKPEELPQTDLDF